MKTAEQKEMSELSKRKSLLKKFLEEAFNKYEIWEIDDYIKTLFALGNEAK